MNAIDDNRPAWVSHPWKSAPTPPPTPPAASGWSRIPGHRVHIEFGWPGPGDTNFPVLVSSCEREQR